MRKDFNRVTVVFEIKDHEAFKPHWDWIFELLKLDPKENPPYLATSISLEDETKRLELIEEALERVDDHYELREVIADILSCPDLSKWSWDEEESPG